MAKPQRPRPLPSAGAGAGVGIDAFGAPVIDPTANVIAILEAAVKRQDDLREAESRHVREIAGLRADYNMELRQAEIARINAIRAVDVAAVQQAAEVSATQATTLAAQVATSAETLRTQVAAAATAATVSLAAALVPIQEAIADLRRAQYEAQGQKTQVIEGRASNSAVYAAIGLGISLVLVLLAVVGFVLTRAAP
jgi:hypothetical protein